MSVAARIPIIRLYGNMIVSIQTSLSDQVVKRLKEDVSGEIERTRPRGLIIDISGIDLMDSYISRAIRDICLIASIMGVKTVLSGMDKMIAITLVEMGMDMMSVRTALNLEEALEMISGDGDGGGGVRE